MWDPLTRNVCALVAVGAGGGGGGVISRVSQITRTLTVICISGKQSDTIQQFPVTLLSDDVCKRAEWYDGMFVRRFELCAEYDESGKSSCKGDSGGPLQCMSSDGRWKLIGITSWSRGCAEPGKPSIFTSVAALLNWIRKYIDGTLHILP